MKDIKSIMQIWFEDCYIIKTANKLPQWQFKCKQHGSIVTLCSFSTENEFLSFCECLSNYNPTKVENDRYEKIMDAIFYYMK